MSRRTHKRVVRPRKKSTREAHETRSMWNRKPYRTKEQKIEARKQAFIGKDGAWHSPAPVSYHERPRRGEQ